MEQADVVVVVCTETYARRVKGAEEAGKGLGVRWESTLTYNDLYQAGGENSRFIPVVFAAAHVQHIPKPLQGTTCYTLDAVAGYEKLYRRLTEQYKIAKPPPGQPKTFPELDRKPLFGDALSPPQQADAQPPLIPGCAGDIFVSYVQADDEQQWVSATIANLKSYMEMYYRTKERFPVWRPYPECTPEAIAAVPQSAIVLIILSRNYLQSGWGQSEERGFLATVQRRVQTGGKIFLIELDDAERPPQFGNFPGHPFWAPDEQQHFLRTFALPGVSDEDTVKYQTQLFQIGKDLHAELQYLLKRAEIRKQLELAGVVIDNHEVDKPLAKRIMQKVKERGVGYVFYTPQPAAGQSPSENRQYFEQTVSECNGLLVIYGAASEEWLMREVNRMRQIFAKYQRQPQAYAIYDGPPEAKQFSETFSFPGIILNCRCCQQLGQDCRNCPGEAQFVQFIERLK
jgi:hypothetical protein